MNEYNRSETGDAGIGDAEKADADTGTGLGDAETGTGMEDAGAGDDAIAKIYYADEEATQVDAAFVIEDWDWVVGFNQVATDEYDYVSIPAGKVIGVMSPEYTSFSRNGRRVTGYGVGDEEVGTFADQLPV